jgi:hopanoid biosynthesis associated protein HpnK
MPQTVRRFLIITADDFGLHEAVNEAVEHANRSGVLTAASLMMGAPATGDAIRRARKLPRLRTGLHLVLADGMAMLAHEQIPGIADVGGFMDDRMFLRGLRYFTLPSVRRQLEAEMRAQFAAFARTGLRLDHVNMHKHFHLHPTLLAMTLRIGREYGVTAVRVPDEPFWFASRDGAWLPAAAALAVLPWITLMKLRLRAAGVFHNDCIFGVAASGAMNEERLLDVLARLPAGVTEIYLHPATAQSEPLTPSMSAYAHADELAALLSPRSREAIRAADVMLGGYDDARRTCAKNE